MTNPAYEATNSDVEQLISGMKAAAEMASPLQLDSAELKRGDDGYIECPCCEGAGEVEALTDFCNIDGVALGVQFYGIGEHHELAEQYFRQSSPANILALISALERAQQSNEFLKGQLSEIANFNPDWDKLEASYESWREIAAELLVAKNRIAELECTTRFVNPPERYRHVKTGNLYDVICNAQEEACPDKAMIVYRSVATGACWVRPASEFSDGRFVIVGCGTVDGE